MFGLYTGLWIAGQPVTSLLCPIAWTQYSSTSTHGVSIFKHLQPMTLLFIKLHRSFLCKTTQTGGNSLREEPRWRWLWAGRGGSRRWGWEAESGRRSGIFLASSRWNCQVCSTPRRHTCMRHRGQMGLVNEKVHRVFLHICFHSKWRRLCLSGFTIR